MKRQKVLVIVVGATAVGKTAVTIDLAKSLGTEVISCDSRQFFREINIGTAKPTVQEQSTVKHHFIDTLSVKDYYNVSMFEKEVVAFLEKQFLDKDVMLMTGGSGLYVDAVCNGIDYMPDIPAELRIKLAERMKKEGVSVLAEELKLLDPEYYKEVDISNNQRVLRGLEVCMATGRTFTEFRTQHKIQRDFKIIKIGLEMDREKLYERINLRVDQMIEDGLLKEVKEMLPYREMNALKTVGYKEIFEYLDGEYDWEEALRLLKRNTRRYAKRQMTWFKRDKGIVWFNPLQGKEIKEYLSSTV